MTIAAATLAEQPELTPVCKFCQRPTKQRRSKKHGHYFQHCPHCWEARQRTLEANQQGITVQPESPPVCKVCGTAKSGYRHSGYRCECWICKRCKNRKQREKYNANTAAGLSDTGVPLEAVSQTAQGRAAAEAVRQRRLATPFGGEVMEALKRERRLGIGGKAGKR